MMNAKYIELDYDEALRYFDVDARELEALAELTEQERGEFHMEVIIDHEAKNATYSYGNFLHASEHLPQKGSGIDNTTETEDDYVGACEKLAEMGEDLGLGLYTCEHCDATFEYRLPWQETCEHCGRKIDDDQIVHREAT